MSTETLPHTPNPVRSGRRRSRDRTVVAIVGGALLIATLAAGAGWALRGASQPDLVAGSSQVMAPPAPMNTAPDDRPAPMVPPSPPALAPEAEDKPAPVRTERTPVARQPAPAPVVAQSPRPVERVAPAVCEQCGVVQSVRAVQRKGDAQGVGAVAGGVLGAVLGNQVGGGNGRTAMTVLGAVGGGVAGNEVEKRMRAETVYEVRVRMDNGGTRTVTQRNAPAEGARVRVDGDGARVIN